MRIELAAKPPAEVLHFRLLLEECIQKLSIAFRIDQIRLLQLKGTSQVEKTSGVWIDGQYLGYLNELKGSKKILLLPGTHKLSVWQNGYQEFTRDVTLQPGEKQVVTVAMAKAQGYVMPAVTSEIKISVNPDRAAVFLDGQYIGHAGEFGGIAKSLIVLFVITYLLAESTLARQGGTDYSHNLCRSSGAVLFLELTTGV